MCINHGWTDKKNKIVMNLRVQRKSGTYFIKSIEGLDQLHKRDYISRWADGCIPEIEEQQIV